MQHLVQEVAYQHWHRMLFARFLADNNLLMYDGVAVSIEECDELAPDEGAKSGWELAGKLAARMLPQVFKPGSPVFELTFAPEHQSELERLLKDLPDAVFKASDSLGWVYQFWQADNKERINKSEVKIGADELPAVTQLFTEPYMVAFLLNNSLGAWWATRHPGKSCPINLDYFRTLEDGTPAAGTFQGWPDSLTDFKMLDPCCGSGHFLVAAFLMLVPMRMAAEGLSAKDAVNRVLAENIYGLEIDPRCVEIAVFAVALEAWRYPDASGNPLGAREIPPPNIACCGLKVAAKVEDWQGLVPSESRNAAHLREGLARLHELFTQAPLLGSLLSPNKHEGDLFGADYLALSELLQAALARESTGNHSDGAGRWDSALSALGLLDVARLLDARYHLVTTNFPFLGTRKQTGDLRDYCERVYPKSKHDLSSCLIERSSELLAEDGSMAFVSPQNWFFLGAYRGLRRHLLQEMSWHMVATLGAKSFQTPMYDFSIALTILSKSKPVESQFTAGFTVEKFLSPNEKAFGLQSASIGHMRQSSQLKNPDQRITLEESSSLPLLQEYTICLTGAMNGDSAKFLGFFWEFCIRPIEWVNMQSTVSSSTMYGGREQVLYFDAVRGHLREDALIRRERLHNSDERGKALWGKQGVLVHRMGSLPATIYSGNVYDQNGAVIAPKTGVPIESLWCYLTSNNFVDEVRKLDNKVGVTPATLAKVPFDLEYWSEAACRLLPNGLPKPHSDDPTQWVFHGHPCGSVVWNEIKKKLAHGQLRTDHTVLQVAIARLLGYRWPAETDSNMELSVEAQTWVAKSQQLSSHVDIDGIVCIPPVGRESSASDRLLNLLADAYETHWSNDVLAQLLKAADHAGKSLETWLRDKFFIQHCALFGNRPFVWHIWDGLRDGFAALVNYHMLDYKTLEALIYTYLGDWISRQKRDADSGVDGAKEKLAAAEALRKRLELILAGEEPYDIFVRWKPIEEQPIGWNPDLNDRVRLNIRPFLSVPDVGKRGAGVLRDKPKSLHWDKDRGSDVPSAPWYELGLQYDGKVGDRINDHHLSLADKRKAREKAK